MISQNLLHRIMTGLPLAAAFIWFVFGAGETVFIVICLVVGLIGYYEYGSILNCKDISVYKPVLYLSLLLLFLSLWFLNSGNLQRSGITLLVLLSVLVTFSFSRNGFQVRLLLWYLCPALWIAGPITVFYLLRFKLVPEKGSLLIFFVILIAAINDIFAFFGGKRFGRHPLAPKVSPKKTIEGSLFGIAGGLIVGIPYTIIWLNDLFAVWQSAIVILTLVISSQLGDLLESSMKRYCGVKDSSRLIPGHGGLLDRIDAYLLALPVFIGLLYIFGIIA